MDRLDSRHVALRRAPTEGKRSVRELGVKRAARYGTMPIEPEIMVPRRTNSRIFRFRELMSHNVARLQDPRQVPFSAARGGQTSASAPHLAVVSRRSVLRLGLASLTLTDMLRLRGQAAQAEPPARDRKNVILLWMTGGPSHIDTWDVKPHAPVEIRGPFSTIPTSVPGTLICEHLPKQAAMIDKFTVIRSVDTSASNHEPNMVMQTGNLRAEPRVNPEASKYPALASAIARLRGANQPGMPPYVAFTSARDHIAWGGYLGLAHDPLVGEAGYLRHEQPFSSLREILPAYEPGQSIKSQFRLGTSLSQDRLHCRRALLSDLDQFRGDLDLSGSMAALDHFGQQAMEMVLGNRAVEAFDLSQEPLAIRERYGNHPWCQQGLLARRLVEAGVSFVTISLSPYAASGAWDNHGDKVVYFGIEKGLKPLLPPFDHLITTLVHDLEERGMLDDTLIVAMGDFGRTPKMGVDGGRDHWQPVASLCLAGGGLRHGGVVGASDRIGGQIAERPVHPGDVGAMIFRHMGVPIEATYVDHQGRPRRFIDEGEPLKELL